jgi:uncharacterized membrane protein
MRCVWLLAAAMMNPAANALADEPTPGFSIVTPKDDGIVATDINGRGEIIGFEWVEEQDQPGVGSQKPFFARGKVMTYLPLLAGYTATFPATLSDDGLVVGRVSKPLSPGVRIPLQNQAFIWDAQAGIRGLGTLKGDNGSSACGVTRDGRRISGYSIGHNGKRACYWEREGDGWKAMALPQESWLGSTVVAISDDGKFIAAVSGGSCCLWSEGPRGIWKREEIAEAGALVPRAVNNEGTVAGIRFNGDGNDRAAVWTRGQGIRTLELPAGYVRSEATDVNNAGVVVGMIDGPRGSKTGPRGFAYERDKLHILTQGDLPCVGAAAINDLRQIAGTLEKDEDDPSPDAVGKPLPAPIR